MGRRSRPTRPTSRTSASARRPVAVAVTGGIGAGKTELLHAFERHGAAVVSSDEIVHELLRVNPEVRSAVRERWGERVVGPEGEIDRAKVAEIVFVDRAELAWLEELLHPRVVATYLDWRERLARSTDPPALCVTEVPLLYEVGGETRFDAVVAVTASAEARASRVVRPMDDREERLLPDEEKLRRADFAFVNDGPLEELDAFASDVVAKLTDPC